MTVATQQPRQDSGPESETGNTSHAASIDELVAQLPASIQVADEPSCLIIQENWFHWSHCIALTVVGLLASAMFVFGVTETLCSITGRRSLHGAIVGFMPITAYWAVAGFLNSTTITVTSDRIVRSLGPLPWIGGFDIAAKDVNQLFVTRSKRQHQHRTPQLFSSERRKFEWLTGQSGYRRNEPSYAINRIAFTYRLHIELKNKARYQVSRRYDVVYTPRIFEHLIEARIGVVDAYTRGEVPSSH